MFNKATNADRECGPRQFNLPFTPGEHFFRLQRNGYVGPVIVAHGEKRTGPPDTARELWMEPRVTKDDKFPTVTAILNPGLFHFFNRQPSFCHRGKNSPVETLAAYPTNMCAPKSAKSREKIQSGNNSQKALMAVTALRKRMKNSAK
jgi:hypothetical protein